MPECIQGMANGINNNKYKLIDAVRGMAGQMAVDSQMTIQAPALKNVGGGSVTARTDTSGNSELCGLLVQLVNTMQDTGDITIPVYLGNDLIDEQIIRASDRRTVRSGGRA